MGALYEQYTMIYPNRAAVPTTSLAATVSWPSASPVFSAGILAPGNGIKYDVRGMEGLMAFNSFQDVYVYGGGNSYQPYHSQGYLIAVHPTSPNVYTYLAALCALVQYGHEDGHLTIAQLKNLMRSQRVRLQCGNTADLIISYLADRGFAARRVHILTGQTPNNLDDGHVAIEVYIAGKWRFVDVAGDCYYTDGSGNHLSLYDIVVAGVANCTKVRLAPTEFSAGRYDAPVPQGGGITKCFFNARPYCDINLSDDAAYDAWANRVWQIPGVWVPADGKVYFYTPAAHASRASWVASLSPAYQVVSEATYLLKGPQT